MRPRKCQALLALQRSAAADFFQISLGITVVLLDRALDLLGIALGFELALRVTLPAASSILPPIFFAVPLIWSLFIFDSFRN